jgi:hypothetical protein
VVRVDRDQPGPRGRERRQVYPKRTILGLALFVGQAFLYNGVTFDLGTLLHTFYGLASGVVPVFIVIYAIGNFLGPVTLGRLFDSVGRKPMISLSYLGSAVMTVPLALLFAGHVVNQWGFLALLFGTFFLASAGASAAYLTAGSPPRCVALRHIRPESDVDIPQLRNALHGFPRIGETGAHIFCWEAQVVWPRLRPYFDGRALSSARKFGLPTYPEQLAGLVASTDVGRLAAALVRASLDRKR